MVRPEFPRARHTSVIALRVRVLSALILCASFLRAADALLFPTPLHITRELGNSISGRNAIVEEYCYANRVVSQSGDVVSIADYAKHELTRIDRANGTYSITSFDELARAHGVQRSVAATSNANGTSEWRVRNEAPQSVAGRSADAVVVEREGASHERVSISADRNVALSRDAVEVLLGVAYPSPRGASADAVVGALERPQSRVAANGSSGGGASYRLPLEWRQRIQLEDAVFESHSRVVRIGNEPAPPDLLIIPPGAKRVESEAVVKRRLLDELDHPASITRQ